jgi:hypothetical protein
MLRRRGCARGGEIGRISAEDGFGGASIPVAKIRDRREGVKTT